MAKFNEIKAGKLFRNNSSHVFQKKDKKNAVSLEESLEYSKGQVVKFKETDNITEIAETAKNFNFDDYSSAVEDEKL